MSETTAVRTVYVYAMCVLAVVCMGWGVVTAGSATAHAISPSTGHRDLLDRVGIGLTNVVAKVIDRVDAVDTGSDRADDVVPVVADSAGDVRKEFETQIRGAAYGAMIRGLLLFIVGAIIWMVHARRTALFGTWVDGDPATGSINAPFRSRLDDGVPHPLPDPPGGVNEPSVPPTD